MPRPSRAAQRRGLREVTGAVRIGISGWRYAGWRGVFYPGDLPQRRELEFASRALRTIELNGSFYSLQRPQHYAQWYAETPAGFIFSIKGGRYITHIRRLQDVRTPLANFFASGLLGLREKLGPLLWQFPPTMKFDAQRFDAFLTLLPRDTASAATLAAEHSAWMAGRSAFDVDENRPLRHAVEIRHQSFCHAAFVRLLRRHEVALVVADSPAKWPYLEDVTADFMYLRLHGDEALYASGYTDAALDRWAARIERWRSGGEPDDAVHAGDAKAPLARAREVFCYFDNDAKVRAPFDAQALMARLALTAVDGPQPAATAGLVATPDSDGAGVERAPTAAADIAAAPARGAGNAAREQAPERRRRPARAHAPPVSAAGAVDAPRPAATRRAAGHRR